MALGLALATPRAVSTPRGSARAGLARNYAEGLDILPSVYVLALGVSSHSRSVCDESYTTVKVSYHGFQLASASAPQVCNIAEDSEEEIGRAHV